MDTPKITEPCGVCEGECKHKDLMTDEARRQQEVIEQPEPSTAFTAGQNARRMRIPIRQSALRKLRPGSQQYDDFIEGYETPLRKQK